MKWDGGYVLEVVKFISEKEGNDGWLNKGGKYEHVGYMKKSFSTKIKACEYYNNNNPHLRKINTHGNYQSDWDVNTKLFYVVRRDYGLIRTIEPW
jgi:hypothetical protein